MEHIRRVENARQTEETKTRLVRRAYEEILKTCRGGSSYIFSDPCGGLSLPFTSDARKVLMKYFQFEVLR